MAKNLKAFDSFNSSTNVQPVGIKPNSSFICQCKYCQENLKNDQTRPNDYLSLRQIMSPFFMYPYSLLVFTFPSLESCINLPVREQRLPLMPAAFKNLLIEQTFSVCSITFQRFVIPSLYFYISLWSFISLRIPLLW